MARPPRTQSARPPSRAFRGEDHFRRSVEVFAALGDETRLSLLSRLGEGSPLSITRLTEGRSQSRQAITKHLRVLGRAGLVRSVRNGRENCFEIRPDALRAVHQRLAAISRQWDDALHRLKSAVENPCNVSRTPQR